MSAKSDYNSKNNLAWSDGINIYNHEGNYVMSVIDGEIVNTDRPISIYRKNLTTNKIDILEYKS